MRCAPGFVAVLLALLLVVPAPALAAHSDAERQPSVSLAGGASAADAGTGANAGRAASGGAAVRYRVELTPDRPGEVRVTATVATPSKLASFRFDLRDRQTVVESDGFLAGEGSRWRWDGRTDAPTLTYRAPVNRTSAAFGGLNHVDVGPWALVRLADLEPASFYYRYRGSALTYDRRFSLAGPGEVGDAMAYLGPSETTVRETAGQRFRLVVPEAARLAAPPDRVFDSLGRSADALRVGARDGEVVVFAGPSPLRRGGQAGDRDAWVCDRCGVETPRNTWIHEYVHTRQSFEVSRKLTWFNEASAEYYAALFAWQQRLVSFESFHRSVTTGRQSGDVLAAPDGWSSPTVPYTKGAHVLAALDAKIRAESGGERTLQTVFRRMNDHPDVVTDAEFRRFVADAAGTSLDGWLDTHVGSDSIPSVPRDRRAFATVSPTLDGAVQFSVRDAWESDPGVVPAGVPVAVRYDGDEAVSLRAGAGASAASGSDADADADDGRTTAGAFVFEPGTATVEAVSYFDSEQAVAATVRADADVDGDGLANAAELTRGTDVWRADTDGDGLRDGAELARGTDPAVADTDGDGLEDGAEVELGADPSARDTDGDGLEDGAERARGTDPTRADTDGDGLGDGAELARGTDPAVADTDGDGYADGREVELGTDPTTDTDLFAYYLAVASALLSDVLAAALG